MFFQPLNIQYFSINDHLTLHSPRSFQSPLHQQEWIESSLKACSRHTSDANASVDADARTIKGKISFFLRISCACFTNISKEVTQRLTQAFASYITWVAGANVLAFEHELNDPKQNQDTDYDKYKLLCLTRF